MRINLYLNINSLFRKLITSFYWRFGRFKMKFNGVIFGKNLLINGNFYIKKAKNSKLLIGDNCCINSGIGINPLSRNIKSSLQVENGATLNIGNNCGFSSVCLWAHNSIFIGNHVNIGADTIILDSDSHSLFYFDRRNIDLDMKNKVSKTITIDDDVLIGTRCIILKGVHIGARSIIGSGSVVVKDIPSDCIAAGNPAKVIKKVN